MVRRISEMTGAISNLTTETVELLQVGLEKLRVTVTKRVRKLTQKTYAIKYN